MDKKSYFIIEVDRDNGLARTLQVADGYYQDLNEQLEVSSGSSRSIAWPYRTRWMPIMVMIDALKNWLPEKETDNHDN